MIDRYTLPDLDSVFSDEARMRRMLEVELLATEGFATAGVVPAADAAACRQRAPVIDAGFVAAVHERERVTDHDVAAFVDVVQERIGQPEGNWIHYGLTSSDVVDTAQCVGLAEAADVLLADIDGLVSVLVERAREFRHTPCMGRTHGIHAEPTTFGSKLALWALQAGRDRTRLRNARAAVAVGKLSGAVGTYSNIDPQVEAFVCDRLGLRPVPATQVVARDRHAELLYACASVGATLELVATEVRHLQRTEVGEAREGFKAGQKGSSAMPHKRNPIVAERLSGLARVLRGNLGAALENVALWHERDISHSSVERIILPDSLLLAHYMMVKGRSLIADLVVDADRMLANIDSSLGLVFSQSVLLALVAGGLSRDEAYRICQDNALAAWDDRVDFRSLLEKDERVTLSADDLDRAFDLSRAVAGCGRVFDALDDLDA